MQIFRKEFNIEKIVENAIEKALSAIFNDKGYYFGVNGENYKRLSKTQKKWYIISRR